MRQLVQATIALFKLGHSLLMVRSIGKSGFRFKIRISDLQSNGKSENGFQRWDICFWIFIFTVRLEIRKRIWKTVLKNSSLASARIISKKRRPLFTRTVLQSLFRFFQSNGKKEIHEIRIWISKLKSNLRTDFSEVKSVFGFRVRLQNPKSRFQNLNPDFLIERNLNSGR